MKQELRIALVPTAGILIIQATIIATLNILLILKISLIIASLIAVLTIVTVFLKFKARQNALASEVDRHSDQLLQLKTAIAEIRGHSRRIENLEDAKENILRTQTVLFDLTSDSNTPRDTTITRKTKK